MAKILFCWELGSGLGHVGPFYPIARRLIQTGHQLTLIVTDRTRTERLFHDLPVVIVDAPKLSKLNYTKINPPITFTDILHNKGWGSYETLLAHTESWRSLVQQVQPDLLLSDFSPTALLASRELDIPRIAIGNGFFCPPHETPLPPLCNWRKDSTQSIIKREDQVLRIVNQTLERLGLSMVQSISHVLSDVNSTILTTFSELDHYPNREQKQYVGVWPFLPQQNQVDCTGLWPKTAGPRIFAYLKPNPSTGHLLQWITNQKLPTIVVGDGLDIDSLSKIPNPYIHFSRQPLDLNQVGQQCDVAITNATHGTTCSLLLSGTPQLLLPRNLEQAITANNVVNLGAGLDADLNNPQQIIQQLNGLLSGSQYKINAKAFADKYQAFNANETLSEIVLNIEQLLQGG